MTGLRLNSIPNMGHPAMKNKWLFLLGMIANLSVFILTGCSVETSGVEVVPTSSSSPTTLVRTVTPPAAPLSPSPMEASILPSETVALPTATATDTALPDPTPTVPSLEEAIVSLDGLPIDAFFEESYRQLFLRDPDRLFLNGLANGNGDAMIAVPKDRFSDWSIAYLQETVQLEIAILELLRGYDRGELTPDQALSYDIYAWVLEDRIAGQAFMFHDMPVNSLSIWGQQNWLVDFMNNYQPIQSIEDAEAYINRLSHIDIRVDQLLAGLEFRRQAGIIPPKFILEGSLRQIEDHIGLQWDGTYRPEATALYADFRSKLSQVDGLDKDEVQDLEAAVLEVIQATFIPAYLELREALEHLETLAPVDGGVWTLPDGEAYYRYALHHEANTRMTPDEIHELGLAELARVQGEIQAAATALGYDSDELDERLAADSPRLQGPALRTEFERLIALADGASRAHFNPYPAADLVIQQDPYGSLAYYLPPPMDGSGPGHFFVNLERPTPKFLLPALTYHETIPGHHLQGALARGLDIPTFRKDIEFNAYMEGWALYAEYLAWEMGLYGEDPLSNLGRLQFEEMRALRLVVDTGVHDRGWTWSEASARIEALTGEPVSQAYLTRFLILPGQACGYTIGMLKILELRQRTMDALGEDFDLAAFHDVILGNGPMPLEILEGQVDAWIEAHK